MNLETTAGGIPVVPADAHIRLASPAHNEGQRILRCGYSYVDGIDPVTGSLAGGLLLFRLGSLALMR